MSIHVYGSVITARGVAANNRGENEGNITTLQKLLWQGQVHTTVSAEAIRWAIRYYWQMQGIPVNRVWNDEKCDHEWVDSRWEAWTDEQKKAKAVAAELWTEGSSLPRHFIDDDILGFMLAEAGKTEGSDPEETEDKGKKSKKAPKGTCDKRRGILEVTRAVSLLPYAGDITFNAKSGEKGRTSLYGTEVHATRYQYSFAMTPERAWDPNRALQVLDAVTNLGEVAGNHSRFLYDFSPESILLRVTSDPAPRILNGYAEDESGQVSVQTVCDRISSGDIEKDGFFVGGPASAAFSKLLDQKNLFPGVKGAAGACKKYLSDQLAGK